MMDSEECPHGISKYGATYCEKCRLMFEQQMKEAKPLLERHDKVVRVVRDAFKAAQLAAKGAEGTEADVHAIWMLHTLSEDSEKQRKEIEEKVASTYPQVWDRIFSSTSRYIR